MPGVDEYWRALGMFIHQFSSVEATVQVLLWQVAETSTPTAKAIFSGAKTDVACSFVRRIFQGRGEELPALLNRSFIQLAHISNVRNSIVHYGAKFDGREIYASNALLAMPGKEIRHAVSAPKLDDMRADLDTISGCLLLYLLEQRRDAEDDELVHSLRRSALAPWLYTPPPQPPASKPSQPKTPRRQRPPKSSPA